MQPAGDKIHTHRNTRTHVLSRCPQKQVVYELAEGPPTLKEEEVEW